MGESTHTYEKPALTYPLATVWEALHRTADLDLQGGNGHPRAHFR